MLKRRRILLAGGGPLVNTDKHRQLQAQNLFLLMDHSTTV